MMKGGKDEEMPKIELNLRNVALIAGAFMVLLLPFGIFLAYLNTVNPAVPTIAGIVFTNPTMSLTIQGRVGIGFEDGNIEWISLNWLPSQMSYYTQYGGTTHVTKLYWDSCVITASISTTDPNAACTCKLKWTEYYSCGGSWGTGSTVTKENQATDVLVNLSYDSQGMTKNSLAYNIAIADIFKSSPSDGATAIWVPHLDVTQAKFTWTAVSSGQTLPSETTLTASTPDASITVVYHNDPAYTYTVSVSIGSPHDYAQSLLPMRPFLLNVSSQSTLHIAYEYIILEVVGIALLVYALFIRKEA